jgi:hypothetical protein
MIKAMRAFVQLRRVVVAIGCSCAGFLGCATDVPEVTGQSSAAIRHGSADPGDEAVVAIVDTGGKTVCSGTLIAPHLVLTAAHCVDSRLGGIQAGSVVFGSSLADAASTIPIALTVENPQFDVGTRANDVAVLVLPSAATAGPLPLGTSAPSVGATVRVVGWGLTGPDAGDTGQKRQGTSKVTAVRSTIFDVVPDPSQPCEGDSGGPALATTSGAMSVVGVTSQGDSACELGATYTRVDAYVDSFLNPTLAQFAPGTGSTGTTCLFPDQCAGGASACVVAPDDANLSYCTASCNGSSDCPTTMACEPTDGGGSQCRYPLPTPGTYGAACTSDKDCVEGACTTTGVCALQCDPADPACPSGFSCINTTEIYFFCIAPPPATNSGSGGCVAATSSRSGWADALPFAAAWLALVFRRRRSRRGAHVTG